MSVEAIAPRLSRSEQARINGARGTGPTTPEGKARSSQNAFKHGCYAARVILPGEPAEEFSKLLHAYEEQFRPADQLERDLIQDLADARWRIERMKRQETVEWSQACDDVVRIDPRLEDFPHEVIHGYAHRHRSQMQGAPLETIRRAEARYHRDFDRALKTLARHRREKQRNEPKVEQPAPQIQRNEPNDPPPPPQPDPSIEELTNDLPPTFANLPLKDPDFLQALRSLHALRNKNQ
jgi:hypothetical protein